MIRFGSVCSGIEAASVSWEPLGWNAAWFSEIEPFPSAVLAHHWPEVPNLGDMTTIRDRILTGDVEAPDVFCGGTPCQAFSIAGKRGSLSDARGNLSLTFCEIANAIDDIRHARGEPSSVVFWENVPGCLNTHDNAFGCFLAGLAGDERALEPGPRPEPNRSSAYWTWKKESGEHVPKWPDAGCVVGPRRAVAWRVLDAQFFGLAQRRRRVFVVASAREGFNPAEILFEFDGVRRDSPPSREAWTCASALTANGVGTSGADDNQGRAGHLQPVVATLDASYGRLQGCSGQDANHGHSHLIVEPVICMAHGQGGAEIADDRSPTLTCNHEAPIAAYSTNGIGSWKEGVGPLRARPQDSHEMLAVTVVHGTQDPCVGDDLAFALGRNNGGENAVMAFRACGQEGFKPSDISPPVCASSGGGAGVPTVAYGFSCKDHGADATEDLARPMRAMGHSDSHANGGGQLAVAFAENSRAEVRLEGGDGQIVGCLSTGGGKPGQGTPVVCVTGDITHTLKAEGFDGSEDGTGRGNPIVPESEGMAVRRLTTVECARLQGFPDNHCRIPTGKLKKMDGDMLAYLASHHPDLSTDELQRLAVDGPQYKAYGNSWAVNVTRWIGHRIDARLRQCV